MRKKIIFLDIDGTLMDFTGELPESARTALCRAKAEGHQLVLCTGRIKAQIYRELLEMNFDGIIASAGAYIECGGREIYRHTAAPDQLARLVDYFEKTRTTYMLQTEQGVVMTERSRKAMIRHFTDMGMTEEEMEKVMVADIFLREDLRSCPDVEKMAYYDAPVSMEKIQEVLGEYFKVEGASYKSGEGSNGEITCAGENKATGIRRYVSFVGGDMAATVGIGDGPNDGKMLAETAIAIAMGNASDDLKAVADHVTADVDKDGLFKAFKWLQVI
ncbi:Cof-type HAD-IIB family hydrolase [Frisingicoccus sp.]|uniref:Cof-type HAD-IIB family hydrolase n=1 Tax=Frisingicoccus sp. TaxID=1918627 RepID=UPI003AB85373